MRATPGLALSQGMKGGASTISLRGASGSVGLVNIDGIPLHDTWPGALNLDLFPAETFGSTDIQRGSAAIINFGRSLGGMINLHSRNNRDNAAKLHLEGGSWGSLRETVTADLNNDHHGLNLTAGRDDLFDGTHWADSRQGNSERDDFHAYQLAMHLRDQFSEQIKLDSSVYYINNDSGVDKIGLIRFNPPELNNVDDPGRLKQEIWLTQSTASIDLHPKWHSELQLGYTEHHASAVIGDLLPGSAPYLVGASSTSYRWRAGKTVTVSGWMPCISAVFNSTGVARAFMSKAAASVLTWAGNAARAAVLPMCKVTGMTGRARWPCARIILIATARTLYIMPV